MTTILKKHGGAQRIAFEGKTYDFTGPENTCTVEDDRTARGIAKEHREITITATRKGTAKKQTKQKEDKTE